MTRRRGWSDITVTDQFCGAGGSSEGAAKVLGRKAIRMAMNHWKLAVETHNTNFPDTDHDECDISASDPRRYPSTDILITSPECTTHSPAGGNRRKNVRQHDLFVPTKDDPSVERSRATMWDVPRFAEYHRYRRIITENVVEVLNWELFDVWLSAMHKLGYEHKIVCHNSMFSWPTPQSRDRVYINFWRKGDKKPDLDIRPLAPCARCGDVEAVQTWKNGRTVGKYRTQYVYTCPNANCRAVVTPYYYAAVNAIDFSIPAERIGDRERPLKDRTLQRIRYGLEKYGNRLLVVNMKQPERDSSRAWPADVRPIGSVPTWDDYFALAQHFMVETTHTHQNNLGVRGLEDPTGTMDCRQSSALVSMPFIVDTANQSHRARRVRGGDEEFSTVHAGGGNHALAFAPFVFNVAGRDSGGSVDRAMPTQETRDKFGLFTPFLVTDRTNSNGTPLNGSLQTVAASGNHHALITGAAQISMRDMNAMRVAALDAELMTQGGAPQQGLIQKAPFITNHYGRSLASPSTDAVGAMSTREHHGLVEPGRGVDINDCYFRMLQPHEIGRAMAFRDDYKVLGNKREQVRQYGNAVTPPVMEMLITRQVGAMTGERSA
jgi:DNA (cytosine-5)-methyltransferase 1